MAKAILVNSKLRRAKSALFPINNGSVVVICLCQVTSTNSFKKEILLCQPANSDFDTKDKVDSRKTSENGMGVKRKASAVEQEAPPLPDEPVPSTVKEEKIDDEQPPPLPTDEEPPPLPDEDVPEEHPPLPDEPAPLPDEPVPGSPSPSSSADSDFSSSSSKTSTPNPETATAPPQPTTSEPDAWQAIWEQSANAYYFYNTLTHETTWLNPRLPPSEAAAYLAAHPPVLTHSSSPVLQAPPPPEIYDPETGEYAFTARFNAKTGKFQNNPAHTADKFSTQGQLMKTAEEYFDISQMTEGKVVGQSGGALKADRRQMVRNMTKKQRKEFIERCKKKKDEKKREWYRNDDIIVRKH